MTKPYQLWGQNKEELVSNHFITIVQFKQFDQTKVNSHGKKRIEKMIMN